MLIQINLKKMYKQIKKLSLTILLFLLVNNQIKAQDFFNIPDLSQVKVEQLSND